MQTKLPDGTLLSHYAVDANGAALPHYTDCFTTDIDVSIGLDEFVTAFYTTPLFRCERLILRLFGLPSKDHDIDAVLAGRQQNFAAWTVEDRTNAELLMCDVNKRTRSWFRVEALDDSRTRLYFGSAVIARNDAVPTNYGVLLRFHRLYSRSLLRAAVQRLKRLCRSAP